MVLCDELKVLEINVFPAYAIGMKKYQFWVLYVVLWFIIDVLGLGFCTCSIVALDLLCDSTIVVL